MRKLFGSTHRHVFLISLSLASIYPVWFIFQTSVKTNEEYLLSPLAIPLHPVLGNFKETFTSFPVAHWALNSLIIAIFSVAGAMFIALLASYAMVFSKMRGVNFLLSTNIALMVIPPVTLVIPMFMLMVNLHLINTLASVIIFYIGLFVPFSVFFLTNFMKSGPYELIEAAKIERTAYCSGVSATARIQNSDVGVIAVPRSIFNKSTSGNGWCFCFSVANFVDVYLWPKILR
jgi:ABC-type glycerol-3-phosphate transport system permease component